MTSFVGVAGGTGAGKTTLARELVGRLGGCVLDLDSYYMDRSALSVEERGRLNYDEPAAIDVDLLVDHLGRLGRGEPVAKPIYSFETHTRAGEVLVAPAPVIVVEGLFTWWWDAVRRLLTLKVFVDAPADIRLIRRLRRDTSERGRTPDEVLEQYLASVRPMHERYVEPGRARADLVLDNDRPWTEAADAVIAALGDLGGDRSESPIGAGASSTRV